MQQDKGAVTRLNNDKTRAKQMSTPGNLQAQAARKMQGSSANANANVKANGTVGMPPVDNHNPLVDRDVSQIMPQKGPQAAQGGGSQIPKGFKPMMGPPKVPDFMPSGNTNPFEAIANAPEIVKQGEKIAFDKLLNSRAMHDAYTKVKLRDYVHQRDSGPDTGRQVLDIMATNL